MRDITERMAAKTAIEDAEARFRSTFEEAPIGMAITAPDGHFLRVNRALGRLLGLASSELEGHHVSEFTHPDDRAADAEAMTAMLAGRRATPTAPRSATCTPTAEPSGRRCRARSCAATTARRCTSSARCRT